MPSNHTLRLCTKLRSLQTTVRTTVPRSPKSIMLPHGLKGTSDEPYTLAPARSTQGSFLQSALRRLLSSTTFGGHNFAASKGLHHGLCERMVLNVDHHRERCQIQELNQSKLQRVAFVLTSKSPVARSIMTMAQSFRNWKGGKREKASIREGEGATLKHPEAFKDEKKEVGVKNYGVSLPSESGKGTTEAKDTLSTTEKNMTKKKERRSEVKKRGRHLKKRNGSKPRKKVLFL